MHRRKLRLFLSMLTMAVVFVFVLGAFAHSNHPVYAADNNFSNGITVDSTGDGADVNVGDSICDDGLGNCTLRAAIEESNTEASTQTIKFNISGTPDFTNGGQNGYTIQPSTNLPDITDTVVIDGYSQPGAQTNTAVSPDPLNGILLIELDGSNTPGGELGWHPGINIISANADNSQIAGLVINNFGSHGIAISDTDNVHIEGNYIGTDPTGLYDEGNGRDYTVSSIAEGVFAIASKDTLIGGPSAADRNVIAGNQAGDIFIGDEQDLDGSENNVISGNYIGVAADGLTALPSGYAYGLGNAILFGHSSNDIVGGINPTDKNVISTSLEFGVSFRDGCEGSLVAGNYIGTDYTGNASLSFSITNSRGTFSGSGHTSAGIHVATVSNGGFERPSGNITIGGNDSDSRNVISGNSVGGSEMPSPGIIIHDGAYRVVTIGNYIGVGADGTTPLGNQAAGIVINQEDGQSVYQNMVGGTAPGEGNLIANNGESGVILYGTLVSQNAILGNSIYSNGGLGIKLYSTDDNPNPNDSLDSDTGPNNLLNFPEYTDISESGGDTIVNYHLDAPAGDYRIEFFSNTSPDTSGFGEGESYLGYQNITHPGGGKVNFSYTLANVTGVTNLAMTTTQRNVATPSGLGATSEFSANTLTPPVADMSLEKSLVNPQDVTIGSTLTYRFVIKNNGDDAFDLSNFTGLNPGVDNLVVDIMPPDITYSGGVDDINVACFSAGAGSAVMFGSSLADHSDHEVVFCSWVGAPLVLDVGDSFNFSFNVTVQPDSNLNFSNYAVLFPGPSSDVDGSVFAEIFNNGYDFISYLNDHPVNNFTRAQYPLPSESTSLSDGTVKSNNGLLSKTGAAISTCQGIAGIIIVAMILNRWRLKSCHTYKIRI